MDHNRINQISAEMSRLLEKQNRTLNGTSLSSWPPEELERYAERNERLRELWKELSKFDPI